ncbi:MAG TPA: PAS domain S-box protein [Gammaproteobacteria bacterium]|nr:PAS domain S-box protein [Gammaproteobacteria bacterium]
MPGQPPSPALEPRAFQSLLDELPYPLVGLDAGRRIALINDQAQVVCGHDPAEVLGRPSSVLFPEELPADPEGARVTCRCRGGEEFRAELAVYELPGGEPGSLLLQLHSYAEDLRPGGGGAVVTPHGRDLLYTEALLRAQLETAPEAIVVADWDHRVLAWNERFLTLWGLSREELAERAPGEALDLVADQLEDPEAFRTEAMRLYHHLDEPEEGAELRLRDGRILERHSRGVRDDRGLYWGRAWYYRDITHRRRAEEALRASETRFRAIYERAAIGIAVVGADGYPVMVNPALQRMLGRTEAQLRHRHFAAFTHDADVVEDLRRYRELVAGKRSSYQLDKRFLTGDGRVLHGRLSASVLLGPEEEGGPLFLAMVEDVTEHTALEEGLRLLAEVLRSANGVMITSPAGRILRVNEGLTRLTGYTADELIGRPAKFLDARQPDPDFYRDMKAALEWQGTWEGEVQGRRKDGSVYPMWETITAVRDDSRRVVRYVSVLTSLTERKMLASERKRRSSAIGELGRLLAHQINQPLAAIGGYAEGARLRLENNEVEEEDILGILRRIAEQARRAADVVADMRRYFRGEPPEAQRVGINTLLHSILPTLPEGNGHSYQIDLDLAEDLPEAVADPLQVQECLINLITNAIEAGPAEAGGPVRIRITTRPGDGAVEVRIRDNGPGVADGLEDKIFQPLFTTKGAGTGLGLPVCLFVAEEHGGRVWLEHNDPGPGVTFRISLPAARGRA